MSYDERHGASFPVISCHIISSCCSHGWMGAIFRLFRVIAFQGLCGATHLGLQMSPENLLRLTQLYSSPKLSP